MDADLVFASIPLSWLDPSVAGRAVQAVSEKVIARTVFPAITCALESHASRFGVEWNEARDSTRKATGSGPSTYADMRANLLAYATEIREFEDNVRRFEQLTASTEEPGSRNLENLKLLFLHLYGSGLPESAIYPQGVIANALAQVSHHANVKVAEHMRGDVALRLDNSSQQLHSQLLKEIRNGPHLLSALEAEKTSLLENTRRFTTWLSWISKNWLLLDPHNNPCTADAKALQEQFAPLVKKYGYPDTLLSVYNDLNVQSCYDTALRELHSMQLQPYGPLLRQEGSRLALNPVWSREWMGLTVLLEQSYFQARNPQAFACDSATKNWRVEDLGRSMSYAAQYQKFAQAQMAPVMASAGTRPLFKKVAEAQLEQVMSDALRSAQVTSSTALWVGLDVASGVDQELARQSEDFAKALDPLLSNLRLFTQLGFVASRARVLQCARHFAADALGRVAMLASASRLYEIEADPTDSQLVSLGSAPVIRDYLSRQVARSKVLMAYADPFIHLLRNTEEGIDTPSDNDRTLPYWINTSNELTRYVQFKETRGQIAELDALFLDTLPRLTYDNCARVLATSRPSAEYGNDLFSERRQALLRQLDLRCHDRQAEQANRAYRSLAARFNRELAGRFPFGGLDSPDASVAVTQAFFADYGMQREALQQSLAHLKPLGWVMSARKFLLQLDAADQLLRGGLGIGASLQSIKLDPEFRIFPQSSPGSEQVISWVLGSGSDQISYPVRRSASLDWHIGQSLTLDLTWAERSGWRPDNQPAPNGYSANGSMATFFETGPWALLRMMQRYQSKRSGSDDPEKSARVLLEFVVPIRRLDGSLSAPQTAQATLYLGLNLSGTGAKSQSADSIRWPGRLVQSAPQ